MFPVMRWAGRRGGLGVSAGTYCVGAALQVRIYLFVMREFGLVEGEEGRETFVCADEEPRR